MKKIPLWRKYEKYITNVLKAKLPDYCVKHDEYIIGKYSNVKRQVDIVFKKKDYLIGEQLVIVECKYLNKKVDVKAVDSYIGFLEDVGADIGILITNKDYSKGAMNRAKTKRIRIEIIPFKELETYQLDWGICQICDPGIDRSPPLINWHCPPYGFIKNGVVSIINLGKCSWCNGYHIKCDVCGAITPIPDENLNEEIECDGGCGLKFKIERKYIHKDLFEDNLKISD